MHFTLAPNGSAGKESACNARDTGDLGSIPELGGSPGGGNGNPLQYSCLENSMDRGAWQATVYGAVKSLTKLSVHTHTHKASFRGKFIALNAYIRKKRAKNW